MERFQCYFIIHQLKQNWSDNPFMAIVWSELITNKSELDFYGIWYVPTVDWKNKIEKFLAGNYFNSS